MASPAEPLAKPLIDKLGVAAGMRVVIMGSVDAQLIEQIRERVASLIVGTPRGQCDVMIYVVEVPADLLRLNALRRSLVDTGSIWVATPRGRAELSDVHVIEAARRAGLVDNKVVRFSDTHTALRLVVPRSLRTGKFPDSDAVERPPRSR